MDKWSVLFAFLSVVALISADTNVQLKNFRIVDTYCSPNGRNTLGPLEAFQNLCPNQQAISCCNQLLDKIRANPEWHLCAMNQQGYQFIQNGCFPLQISSRLSEDEPNSVRPADPQIYFPSEQLNQRLRQTTASPYQQQVALQAFMFGEDPQYNVQVKTPSTANLQNQRPQQAAPQRAQQYPNSANTQLNNDYNDDRPVVILNSRGYQASNFALNLFKNLDRQPNGDAVISPLLPQQLLSNLIDYANPLARKQLQNTAQLASHQLSDMTKSLEKVSKSTVNTIETASANFIAKDVRLNNTYRTDVQLRNVDVIFVDFEKPAQAAHIANKWVSDRTHNLINEVLNPGAVNSYTRLLLTNTIYFKGKWKYAFIETNPGTFESYPNNPRQLSKMYQLNKLRYGELDFADGNGFRWVELPYEGEKLAMLVFLPTRRHQLEASLRQLSADDLAKVMADLQTSYINTKVHLHMPKFTLTDTASLIPALKRMGLHSIFQDTDALRYLANESMVVSDITQRSYMSVDEFGTKATSVASLSIVTLSITPQFRDVKFDVDQPFLTMIVDKQERYPFFIAQINDPRE